MSIMMTARMPQSLEPAPVPLKQIYGPARLHHAPLFHDQNAIKVEHAFQAVGNGHDGVLRELSIHDLADFSLRVLIHASSTHTDRRPHRISTMSPCHISWVDDERTGFSAYLLVASSRSTSLPQSFLSTALAMKKSCF